MVKAKKIKLTYAKQLENPTTNAKLQRELNRWVKPIHEIAQSYIFHYFNNQFRTHVIIEPYIVDYYGHTRGRSGGTGTCSEGYVGVVRMSLWYLRNSTDEQIRETVFHELIHVWQGFNGYEIDHDLKFFTKYQEGNFLKGKSFGDDWRLAMYHQSPMPDINKPIIHVSTNYGKYLPDRELFRKLRTCIDLKTVKERSLTKTHQYSFAYKGYIYRTQTKKPTMKMFTRSSLFSNFTRKKQGNGNNQEPITKSTFKRNLNKYTNEVTK